MSETLIAVQNVSKVFTSGFIKKSRLVAVNDVSLSILTDEPQIITVAGESGSGKTTLAQVILGFQQPSSGEILYEGTKIQDLRPEQFVEFRKRVQAIFQNPFDAFNPFYPVDHALLKPIEWLRLAMNRQEADRMIDDALGEVRLDPAETLGRYPHQLSGGQLQRTMIARALLLKPKLIVADEPVSMIDVSLRAIILDILVQLKEKFGISLLYITHDLSTALQISDRIMIMYHGNVVEQGEAASVIQNPRHPYTQLLVNSIPMPDPENKWGPMPSAASKEDSQTGESSGCIFLQRCPHQMPLCREHHPPRFNIHPTHQAACFLYQEMSDESSSKT
jgi:oligopeptide/dipeptide ABC transporter ATP-binding protein